MPPTARSRLCRTSPIVRRVAEHDGGSGGARGASGPRRPAPPAGASGSAPSPPSGWIAKITRPSLTSTSPTAVSTCPSVSTTSWTTSDVHSMAPTGRRSASATTPSASTTAEAYRVRAPSRGLRATRCAAGDTDRGVRPVSEVHAGSTPQMPGRTPRPPRRPPPRTRSRIRRVSGPGRPSPTGRPSIASDGQDALHRRGDEHLVGRVQVRLPQHALLGRRCRARAERQDARPRRAPEDAGLERRRAQPPVAARGRRWRSWPR